MADETPLTIRQGVTWTQPLEYKDSTGAGINITGWTARMQARTSPNAATTVLDLQTPTGIVLTDAAVGKLELRRTAAETQALTAGTYDYDLHLTKPDGVTRVLLLKGKLIVEWGVTRYA